jgi:hypothetical protein
LFDYDDVLHPSFIEYAKRQQLTDYDAFSFFSGFTYDHELKIAARWPHVSNPFVFSTGQSGSNIFELGNHTQLERILGPKMKVIKLRHPMWLKIVHGTNLGGDKITSLDRPEFGSRLNRNFHGGNFPIKVSPGRDILRVAEYFGYQAKLRGKKLFSKGSASFES